MLGGEAAEEFGDVLLRVIGADGLLLDSSHLGHCVLADLFVRWPVLFLAFLGLWFIVSFVCCEMRQKGEYSRSSWWSSA